MFSHTPLTLTEEENSQIWQQRDIDDEKAMLDNLVELIVFTPRGSFLADPDFGFEYWNHEYANVSDSHFNANSMLNGIEIGQESTKERCQKSVSQSLQAYAPQLEDVDVNMSIGLADPKQQGRRRVHSRHVVIVTVAGAITTNLGTKEPYQHVVEFLLEPHATKRI